ncbi:MAG: 50S ribosomal protein L21 [Patescibacteria group bacterium]
MVKKAVKTTKTVKKEVRKAVVKLVKKAPAKSAWAVVPLSGTQLRVHEGDVFTIDRVGPEVGKSFEVTKVYLVNNGTELKIGQPEVAGAKVVFEVLGDERGEKIDVFKFKAKARYRKRHGHRSALSKVKVISISG